MTTTPPAATGPRLCPNCTNPIPPGKRALCPNCHHPLILDEQDPHGEVTPGRGLHKPTENPPSDPDTVPQPVVPPQPVPRADTGPDCPSCQHPNPSGQQRCERCATILVSQPTMPVPAQSAPPEAPRGRRGLGALLVVGALVVALVLGYAAFRVASSRRPAVVATGSSTSAATPVQTAQPKRPADLRRISSEGIEAEASSTLPQDGDGTYGAENTLDGDPETAWNSFGDDVGARARVKLTYRFEDAVDLRAIEIRNGYQRSTTYYYNNSRVRRLLVSTDSGDQPFVLLDRQGKQTISGNFGRTDRVVLTVEAVYRDKPKKTRNKDCAISDVTFFRS